MALHCPATLVLLEDGEPPPEAGAVLTLAGSDVLAELQALADLHRGETVVVRLGRGGRADVLRGLGRVARPRAAAVPLRLEVGDDGWVVLPDAVETV